MIERKFYVHYLKVPTEITPEAEYGENFGNWIWVRIGQHLEAFAEELNPQVEVRQNIWGYQSAIHNGYQVQSSVDTFYATRDQENNDYYLYKYLETIALYRWTGDMCKTERVEALVSLDVTGTSVEPEWAWKEDCYVTPQSMGGDTSGYQIPFQIANLGNRVDVFGRVSFNNNKMTLTG